jgi:hypothetical protein
MRAQVRIWSTGLRVRRRRTATRGTNRRTITRRFGATIGRYFSNRGGGNEAPRASPDGTARCGVVGQSAAGTDVAVDMTEGELTVHTSPDALS